MKCETCNKKDFVHSDLYCQRCPDKPKSRIKSGRAYLFSKYGGNAITSVEIEAPERFLTDVIGSELAKKHRIEFIEADGKELLDLVHKNEALAN